MSKKWIFDPLKPGKYAKMIIDPATRFKGFSAFESAKGAQYRTMSDNWIRSLPVRHLAAPGCLAMVWSTLPKLETTFSYLRAWGLEYVTTGCWHKKTINGLTSKGTGFVLTSSAEVYLLAKFGKPKYINRPQPGLIDTTDEFDADYLKGLINETPDVIEALRREHSRKPPEQYEIMDGLMGTEVDGVELFARESADGWDRWGNETDYFETTGDDQ